MALERIVLNIIPAGEMPVFHCSQYENGRPVIIDLVSSDDDAYLVPEGASIELHCRKVDDNIVTLEPDEVNNNTVTFVSTEQLTACPGDNLCEIVLYAGTDPVQTIATLNFILHVEPDPMEGGLTSDTQIYNLTEQIEEITQQVIGDDYYDKTEVDTALNFKADKATTYTKSQVDSALALKANTAALAAVATTGNYDDLTNKPTIPAAQVQSDWEQVDNTKVDYIKNKPDLSVFVTSDALSEIIYDLLPTGTASGTIATFDTGLTLPLVDCKANIVASQASGTPTPSSPLPIMGYSSANITRCGKNIAVIFDDDTVPSISNGQLVTGGGSRSDYIKVKPSMDYTLSVENSQAIYVFFYEADKTWINYQSTTATSLTVTIPANCAYIMLRLGMDNQTVGQFEEGSTATAYAPYNGQTYAITFGQTVYGGVLDVTRGKLTVTHANIASYNGESINEPWLSSMDVYTPGGTPTTGAQVVYPLATPFDIELTPVQINALLGVNNVFNDTNGDTTVQYKDSIQHYIDTRT